MARSYHGTRTNTASTSKPRSASRTLAGAPDRDVRLGLREVADPDRILGIDQTPVGQAPLQEIQDAPNGGGVPVADGAPLEDLSFDQLEPLVRAENSGLGHTIELGRGDVVLEG